MNPQQSLQNWKSVKKNALDLATKFVINSILRPMIFKETNRTRES